MKLCMLLLAVIFHCSLTLPSESQSEDNLEKDTESSKKIIGSSVVTSVSVILNGDEPQFTDAVGKPIPKPLVPLQVASPINLLNPDRYEFYTFDENGQLVKRLMTLHEIQSIVANGDGDGATILHNIPISDRDPEKNVQDIVANVQSVLTKEVEWKQNGTGGHPSVLDTPDVSSSWSMILPAIFGNTGGEIFPAKPQQINMTPDTVVIDNASEKSVEKLKTTVTTYRPKPMKTTQLVKRKPSSTKKPLEVVKESEMVQSFGDTADLIEPIFNRRNESVATIGVSSTTSTPKTTTSTTKKIKVKKTTMKPTTVSPSPATTEEVKLVSSTTNPEPSLARIEQTSSLIGSSTPTLATEATTPTPSPAPMSTISTTSTTLSKTTASMSSDLKIDIPNLKTANIISTGPPNVGNVKQTENAKIENMLDEDLNTKISFDQIMETLKEEVPTENIETETYSRQNATIEPMLYNGIAALNIDDKTSTEESSILEENTATIQVDVKTPVKDSQTSNTSRIETNQNDSKMEINSSQEQNNSNVVQIEKLFVDAKDPILIDITTEIPTTDTESDIADVTTTMIATTQKSKSENDKIAVKLINDEKITKIDTENLTTDATSPLVKKAEKYISENINNTETVNIDKEKVQQLLKKPMSTSNTSMSDYKEQAATVASIIENVSTEMFTPLGNSDEIQSLLSEVINQFTDIPTNLASAEINPSISKPDENSHRLSNIAKINAEIIVPQGEKPNPPNPMDSQEFHTTETIDDDNINTESTSITTDEPSDVDVSYETSIVRETSSVSVEMNSDQSDFKPKTNHSAIILDSLSHSNILETTSFSSITPTKTTATSMDLDLTTAKIEEMETTEPAKIDQNSEIPENVTSVLPSKLIANTISTIATEQEGMSEEVSTTNQVNNEITPDDTTTSAPDSSTLVNLDSTSLEDKDEDSSINSNPTQMTDISNITETEQVYIKLGESTNKDDLQATTTFTSITTLDPTDDYKSSQNTSDSEENTTIDQPIQQPSSASDPDKLSNQKTSSEAPELESVQSPSENMPSTLKPVHYHKQPAFNDQKYIQFNNNQRPVIRPPALSNLKVNEFNHPTRAPVKLEPTSDQALGLEASTVNLEEDIQEFARLCNELAFNYWRSITLERISPARSLVISPFALTSMLSMVFLGARGGTSGEMNEILRLDDMVTFNPHLVFKNITDSVENIRDSNVASTAFVREIFTDRSNGKVLQFFKEKTQQLYSGHVEEVNFNVVNDIIRRRTNLLVKRHTMGKVIEYLRTNSVWVNGPLATVSANLFQTDCTKGSVNERDGEMFFQVHPSVRQRRLVPIPAAVWRSGFTAGYDPGLDATLVAFGSMHDTVSTIYVMAGQQGLAAPGDSLERLEMNLMHGGITRNAWSRALTTLMERPGLEVQLPRFSHRSFINASMGLQRMGLKALFNSDHADLRGLTGSSIKDVYLSDMIQINTFSTCGEEKIADHHHVEMYPAPPLRKKTSEPHDGKVIEKPRVAHEETTLPDNSGRAFYDDLLDPKYLELPLPLRPRQARIPDAPRLRFDRPFLYFVRHNPTGMILFMGRFNPRLLP